MSLDQNLLIKDGIRKELPGAMSNDPQRLAMEREATKQQILKWLNDK